MNWTIEELTKRPWALKFRHGTLSNTFANHQKEWARRKEHTYARAMITDEIESIFEPRYITPPETSEFIESLCTMVDARRVLEIGMYSGFTSMHILRSIIGKEGAKITAIDGRPNLFNRTFFERKEISPWFEFMEAWTPEVLHRLKGPFDVIFIDSDHSPEHTQAELAAIWPITTPETILIFHDLPKWPRPDVQEEPPVRKWILGEVAAGRLYGLVLPTCEQLDCRTMWGDGYPPQCNPHLGVFVKR